MLLSCTQWCMGQPYNLYLYPTLGGNATSRCEYVFGERFDNNYTFQLEDESLGPGSYVNNLAPLKLYLKKVGGVNGDILEFNLSNSSKIPAGVYWMVVKYDGVAVNGFAGYPSGSISEEEKQYYATLTVKPRPITFVASEKFHCYYNGSQSFTMDDFCEGDVTKEQFINNCSIGAVDGIISGLASFDNTTVIDFDNINFNFDVSSASSELKTINISESDWKVISNDESVDWSSNYELQPSVCQGYIHPKPITAKVIIDDKAFDGSADILASQFGEVTLKGVIDGDDVRGVVNTNQTYSYPNSAVGEYNVKLPGGSVVLSGSDSDNYECTSASGTSKILENNKLIICPNPMFYESKVYDRTTDVIITDFDVNIVSRFLVKDKDGNILSTNEFLDDDDLIILIEDAYYDEANVSDSRTITFKYSLQGDPDALKKYVLDNTIATFPGKITPVRPTVRWMYGNNDCANQQAQTISYGGKAVEGISAYLVFENNAQNVMFQNSYSDDPNDYKLNGNFIDRDQVLNPGDYTLSVSFKVVNEEDKGNIEAVTSSINVTVAKVPIELRRSGNTADQLEYGAMIAYELAYVAGNLLEGVANVKYTYYLCKDLNITEDELFSDDNKVEYGYQPKVGTYKFGCVAVDKNGFMLENRTYCTIDITKSSKFFPIIAPVIARDKDYDGNPSAKVEINAKFSDIELPTTAYYVDLDIDFEGSMASLTEGDFRKDAGRYSIFYKLDVPDEILNNYNLYVDSYQKDGQIFYETYDDDAYIYYKPGEIKCVKPGFIIDVPDEVVYGECTLGGDDENDAKIYTTYNGEIVSKHGQWLFLNNHEEYHKGYNGLNVGTYSLYAIFVSNEENFCLAYTDNFSLTVVPKTLTFDGDLHIADKYEDGTAIIERSNVTVPNVVGILPADNGKVQVEWDYSNTEYPSADVKYADEDETIVAAYENIPVGVSIKGLKAANYKLVTNKLLGSSKILPFVFEYNIPSEDVKTYRLVYGNSVLGVDLKVVNDLPEGQYVRYMVNGVYDHTFMMEPPNVNPEEYYNIDVQVVEGDREADALKDEVKILSRQKIKLYVDKFKLKISEPEVYHSKIYDGNTSVKWINGNNCRLLNVVDGDDVRFDGEPAISYDTPEIGRDKKITVTFSLKGDHLYRYLLPDDVVFNDGIIMPETVTLQSVKTVESGYCAGSDIVLNVKVSEGIPSYCNIVFGDDAKNVGFEDLNNVAFEYSGGDDVYTMSFACPSRATHGKFSAKLQLLDLNGDVSVDFPFDFTVYYGSDYIKSKFTDVVLVDNSEFQLVGYQWYKREVDATEERIITGETKQFYRDQPYLYGWYSAVVYTVDNEEIKICPAYFDKRTSISKSDVSSSVSVYPNPAANMETVTIRLNDFDEDSYDDAIILIYNSMGSVVTTLQNIDEFNTVNLPSGSYTGVVAAGGTKLSFKFIVRN